MEINIVAPRSFLVEMINGYMKENNLIFFDDSNGNSKKDAGKILNASSFDKDLLIQIGEQSNFETKIKYKAEPDANDKIDFIYLMQLNRGNNKICEAKIIWSPEWSAAAKKNGIALKKIIAKKCHQGMMAINEAHAFMNKSLKKFYWPEEVMNYTNLYKWEGNVQIKPIINQVNNILTKVK
jgi:hypothetical protein